MKAGDHIKANPAMLVAAEVSGGILDRFLQAWETSKKCKVALRELAVEERRIQAQAKLGHAAIQADFRLKLQRLRNERQRFEQRIRCVEKEFSNLHLQRMKVLELAGKALAKDHVNLSMQCVRMVSNLGGQSIRMRDLLLPENAESKMLEALPCLD